MKKRVVALFLGMAMAVTALAGCGSTDTVKESSQTESTEKAEESSAAESTQDNSQNAAEESEGIALDAFAGTELTVAVKRNTADKTESWNDKEAFKMAEEATGIHINFVELEESVMSERVNIMLASGDDMPDAFWGVIGSGTISANKELFYDLSEEGLLETYAPNVLADYATLDGGKGIERVTWPDGSIYSLMSNQASNIKDSAQGVLLINKGWLDKLGLEVPKTGEEFLDALRAFRDNDMDGDGDTKNEIPFEFCENNWAGHIINLADCWGIASQDSSDAGHWRMLKDGKVYPTLDTDAYRAYLEFVHQMVEENLIDVEGFSQTNEQYKAKLATGTVGCFPGYTALHVMGYEYAKDFVPVLFQGMEGVEPIKTGVQETNSAYTTTFVASANCENIEALLHWWNYLSSSTEMKWTVNLGPKGGAWDIDEEGNVIALTPAELSDDFNATNYNYTYGVSGGLMPLLRDDEIQDPFVDDPQNTSYWRYNICMEMMPYMTDEYWPRRFVDEAAQEEKNFIAVDLTPVITSYSATSMMEGVTDKSWEQFLDDLEAYGYYDLIDWYQRWVDGEF